MKWVALIAGLALVLATPPADAHDGEWNVMRTRVGADAATTLHGPDLPQRALVRTWARVDGRTARAVVDGPHLVLYRSNDVDIIQRTGRNIRWRIANHAGTTVRVSVGWQRFR